MYGSGGTRFFVYPSRYKASGHTQMSLTVDDIKSVVAALKAKGVEFEEYDLPGIKSSGRHRAERPERVDRLVSRP
ncbi:MAG: hypothetical protein ABI334_04065 [Candidatus Dormiibacterota bacterium]